MIFLILLFCFFISISITFAGGYFYLQTQTTPPIKPIKTTFKSSSTTLTPISNTTTPISTPINYIGDTLSNNLVLLINQGLKSENNKHYLQYQDNGNLVLYNDNSIVWQSFTSGPGKVKIKDGKLVIFDNDNNILWSS